jgi:hypothetical protein
MDIDRLLKLAELFSEAVLLSEAAHPRADYMRDYMRQRYHSKRQKAIDALGGKCVHCGNTKNLHLDHIDKKKKTMRASDIHSTNDKKVEKEMQNLQLLCENCHKKKTHEAWDYSTPKPTHGTYWMARKYKCQCDDCTKAYHDKIKEWAEKAKDI